jgi:cell division protein FtsN
VLILLLLVLSGGGIFVGIKYEEVKTYMGWNTFDVTEDAEISSEVEDSSVDSEEIPAEVLTETEVIFEDTSSTELEEELVSEEVETNVVEEPIEETTIEQPISGKQFHLIGGSFSSAENAEKFAKDLQSKGLPARVLGQFNGLHMVSVKSFSSQGDAFAELKTIQEQAPGAWLFKYPK